MTCAEGCGCHGTLTPELEELDRELRDAYALERDAERAGDADARDRARARIAAAQAREHELRAG